MQVWNVRLLHAARWKYRTQKWLKNSSSANHRTNLSSQLRHESTIGKKTLLSSNISSRCPHNMVNFGLLTAKIGWQVWGTPTNFNGFRVLASLLHWHRSTEANQTLHDVWPSHGLVHYIHFRGLLSLTEFCQVQNSLCLQVLCSPILAALLHGTPAGASARLCGVQSSEGATYIR